MPDKQIATPFGYSGNPVDGGGFEYRECQSGGAISVGQVVQYDNGVNTGVVVASTAASAYVAGISLDAASAAGQLVRVVVGGFLPAVPVDSGAGVTAGDFMIAASTGFLANGTEATFGTVVGVCLETTAASGNAPILVKLC